jgi:serine/threonine-protein kinase
MSPKEANEISGTPLYLSPEAIRSPATVDSRSDIYSVGVLGYFLLTGTHPFEGKDLVEVCRGHLESSPPDPSSRTERPLPADLVAAVLSCLEKDPGRRPPSVANLAARLDGCGCAHEWTECDARDWWRAFKESPFVPGPASSRDEMVPLQKTALEVIGPVLEPVQEDRGQEMSRRQETVRSPMGRQIPPGMPDTL